MRTKQFSVLAVAIFGLFIFSSCSKKEDGPSGDRKNAKITFSVSNTFKKAEGDDFSLGAGGGTGAGKYVDWKVDGKTEVGTVVTVGSDYVNGGKSNVVVESAQSFDAGSVTISFFNIGGAAYTVTYKVEVNSKVIDEKTVTISDGNDAFYKNYTF